MSANPRNRKTTFHSHLFILLFTFILLTIASGTFIIYSQDEKTVSTKENTPLLEPETKQQAGRHVIILLESMQVLLVDGTTTIETIPIVSKGRPGSYFETIGGKYENDYKEREHFSSIGHVYMPWSVHVFGNFFIHGIPFYPNGEKVSSTYSGGCIRLADTDAKKVYDFVTRSTPILIVQSDVSDFEPTATSSVRAESMDMTRLMVAIISLEMLTQDDPILNTKGEQTTRRQLLPNLLLLKDASAAQTLSEAHGSSLFISEMNAKAKSLGLSNTFFTTLTTPAQTTEEDLKQFMNYVTHYKSYLLTLPTTKVE